MQPKLTCGFSKKENTMKMLKDVDAVVLSNTAGVT
jgi:hypothetical protein